jgi:hypothetical protein
VSGNSYSPSNASSGGSPLSDSGEGNSPRSPVSAGVSERAGGPASAVTFKEWVPGMVMVVTDPAYVGYEGVIEAKADDSGMVRVSIDIQGGARSVTLSHSNLKPAVIQKGDRVYVFKADPGKILPNREGLCAVRLLSPLVSHDSAHDLTPLPSPPFLPPAEHSGPGQGDHRGVARDHNENAVQGHGPCQDAPTAVGASGKRWVCGSRSFSLGLGLGTRACLHFGFVVCET